MVLRCYVPGCRNKGRFGFHKFPRDKECCLKWQRVSRTCNLNTNYLPYSHYRVCERHFIDQDYTLSVGKKRLKKLAVPSVFVPEDPSVYDEHNYVQLLSYQGEVRLCF